MLKTSKTFLAVDFGAGTLKIAELAPAENSGLRLLRYGLKPLGLAGSQDAAREGVVKKALAELLTEGGFTSKDESSRGASKEGASITPAELSASASPSSAKG